MDRQETDNQELANLILLQAIILLQSEPENDQELIVPALLFFWIQNRHQLM